MIVKIVTAVVLLCVSMVAIAMAALTIARSADGAGGEQSELLDQLD